MEEFSNWLQEELKSRGWDQSELARRGGITPSHISRIISEYRRPGPTTCRAIARALQIPVEDVFRRAGLLPRARPERVEGGTELLFHYSHLASDDRDRLLLIARALHNATEERNKKD